MIQNSLSLFGDVAIFRHEFHYIIERGGGRCIGIRPRSGMLPPRFVSYLRITIPSVGTTISSTPRYESTTLPIGGKFGIGLNKAKFDTTVSV